MVKNGFKVLDSDLHVIEPLDLGQRYTDPEFRGEAPRGIVGGSGIWSIVGPDGRPWGRNPTYLQKSGRLTASYYSEYEERMKPYQETGWSAQTELKAMDAEGVDVAVIYPTLGLYALAVPDINPKLAAAIARAYNNWLHEFCQADSDRLIGAALVSPFDVNDAVAETRRSVKDLGFKGIMLRPNEVNRRNWYDPYYDPLWSELEELDVPVGFHEGAGAALPYVGEEFGDNIMLAHAICHPLEQMLAATSFCAGGILARHPNLRVAFLEGNSSWLPFLMWRWDEHWEALGNVYGPELKLSPSEYFKRQCLTSVEADEEPVKFVIDHIGSNRFVFSTDFPHFDSKFPHAVERFLELSMGEDDKRRILWDNCARYYGLSPDNSRR